MCIPPAPPLDGELPSSKPRNVDPLVVLRPPKTWSSMSHAHGSHGDGPRGLGRRWGSFGAVLALFGGFGPLSPSFVPLVVVKWPQPRARREVAGHTLWVRQSYAGASTTRAWGLSRPTELRYLGLACLPACSLMVANAYSRDIWHPLSKHLHLHLRLHLCVACRCLRIARILWMPDGPVHPQCHPNPNQDWVLGPSRREFISLFSVSMRLFVFSCFPPGISFKCQGPF